MHGFVFGWIDEPMLMEHMTCVHLFVVSVFLCYSFAPFSLLCSAAPIQLIAPELHELVLLEREQ